VRIAMVCAPYESCPPTGYGGIERVVGWWTKELLKQGHEVDLFARKGSTVGTRIYEWEYYGEEQKFAEWVYTQIDLPKVDIVVDNSHEKWLRFFIQGPYIAMLHMESCPSGTPNIVGCSRNNAWMNHSAEYVHLGVDLEEYELETEKEDYLLYMGAIAPHKQVHLAIDMAHRLHIPIKVAGPRREGYEAYHDQIIAMLEPGEYVGEVKGERKQKILGGARAKLWPINWEEPGGTIAFEAAACGTPIIAYERGCAGEIIQDGVTGFLPHNPCEMADAIDRIDELDPKTIREYIEQNFSMPITIEKQLALYERAIAGETW